MAKAKYELDNGVALITLNDPATLNAIAVDMTEELTVFFERASEEAR
jgi:enoyl-CoA hydratase/carnithine racemase